MPMTVGEDPTSAPIAGLSVDELAAATPVTPRPGANPATYVFTPFLSGDAG